MRTSEYDRTLHYLFGLRTFGIHLGLEISRSLAEKVGNPQNQYPAVHIAGTNGKGSTCSLIESVLREKGLKTGLYTSPHLIDFNERIKVNGVPISDEAIIEYAETLKESVEKSGASFFEVTTVIALKYFADMEVDIAVVETGLGARLDTTMLVNPVITIISSISIDHAKYLGDTIKKIAKEKSFVMRKGVKCVVSKNSEEVLEVIKQHAEESDVEILMASGVCTVSNVIFRDDGLTFDAEIENILMKDILVPLMGEHQIENIQSALTALRNMPGLSLAEEEIRNGFNNVSVRGRMEIVSKDPLVIYDVAHNPNAVKNLFKALNKHYPTKRIVTLLALLSEKDHKKIIKELSGKCAKLICSEIPGHDSVSASNLSDEGNRCAIDSVKILEFDNALQSALNTVDKDSLLIIFGSHYFAENVYTKFSSFLQKRDRAEIKALT